ncbi:D-alanine--D-alanine ligase family protein [Bdellovibrio sp. HCB337]|uniref:D-alanine--D-alanine ligase family protein n=1 Tax=Bdellovibrio sp. HCB337 TaxID=3394358 RepID=UPI0039A63173
MKKTIALIFGGKSSEHEVSLRSAKNVANALDKSKYDFILVGISKEGSWYRFAGMEVFDQAVRITDKALPTGADPVALISEAGKPLFFSLKNQNKMAVDCAFPILHGTFGEDGTIQGLFKMMNLPFVGCGVWSSAAGMDKEVMKRLLFQAGINNAKYELLTPQNPSSYEEISKKLGSPFFIKPANAGSSVGVHKIKSKADFDSGLKDAFTYDSKVLAEEFVQGREIECSVMGHNRSPKASLPGEVIAHHEFYSYEAKYVDEKGASIVIPAQLTPQEIEKIQKMAVETYQVMGCDGLTRVDFFLKKSGDLFVNEINTIPGFTKISMYPKMWEATGVSYSDLITKLISFAFERHTEEEKLMFSYLALN